MAMGLLHSTHVNDYGRTVRHLRKILFVLLALSLGNTFEDSNARADSLSSSFSGHVWTVDSDTYNVFERAPMAGVHIGVFHCTGDFVTGVISDEEGNFLVPTLTAGCYRFRVRTEQGYRVVRDDQSATGNTAIKLDPTTGLSGEFDLEEGQSLPGLNIDVIKPRESEFGDRVWEDRNANGRQDFGEPGLAGVEVNLLTCDGNPALDAEGRVQRVISDTNGDYLFSGLKPDCYRVRYSVGGGFLSSSDLFIDGFEGDVGLYQSHDTLVAWPRSYYGIDSGFYRGASLGNRVWLDSNRDGIQQPEESGLGDVTVLLLDAYGVPVGPQTQTDAEGYYTLDNIPPGHYQLQFVAPNNLVATDAHEGASGALDSDANRRGLTPVFELRSDERVVDFDFGVMQAGALSIELEKSTNGVDADTAPGVFVLAGDPVVWTYDVVNTGEEFLFQLEVVDDQGVNVTCPTDQLAPGAGTQCTAPEDVAQAGQYTNVATVTANDGSDNPMFVSATDASNYFGAQPSVTIEKQTNQADSDTPPGEFLVVGAPVEWRYIITNTGNVTLNAINVVDDQGVDVVCPSDTLPPAGTMTCTGMGQAIAGQYANVGTVDAAAPVGPNVTASDPSHYFGGVVSLSVEKSTNGIDADTPAQGPFLLEGDTVTWTYVVTNTGDFTLSNVTVVDDQGVALTCSGATIDPNATITCTGSGVAIAGQYRNEAEACGDATDVGASACDVDVSHYFGESGTLSVEKSTNGEDADTAPGPFVAAGSTVNWLYAVTNNSNVTLTDLVVSDNQGVVVTCPVSSLSPGASTTCTGTGTATAGQYQNIGSATATTPGGNALNASDPSHYFGESGTLDLEKRTNGEDADVAPGPSLAIGSAITWTYVVTNNTNVEVTGISVTDSQGVAVTCPADSLAPGATLTCTGTGTATAGQYMNLGTVTGTTPSGTALSGNDPSHYFGEDGNVAIEKSTNGEDADVAPGPFITVGTPITWTYVVTNNTNVEVTGINVADDQGVKVTCPVSTLAPGQSITCTGTGTATEGQYANIGTVTGNTPGGTALSASDPSHYFGEVGSLDIEKSTNGLDADVAPGPVLLAGSPVSWTYIVTNNTNAEVSAISVTDDQGVTVTCPATTLAAGASFTCSGSGTAIAGQYANIGSVVGSTPSGSTLSDSDPSHYFGESGTLDIEKFTNDQDADLPPGPALDVGSVVNWTYVVTNNANVNVSGVSVTDDQGVIVSCPVSVLPPGGSVTCTGTGTAVPGQYANIGTVIGLTQGENTLTDSDPSHYFGESGTLDIEKLTNGQDADSAPGPALAVGATVSWTYVVTNNTNGTVSGITVTDDQGVVVSCPSDTLAPGASLTCTGSGTAIAGQYTNIGTVTGTTPGGNPLSDADPSHYFGESGTLDIEKSTNGQDADVAPGPSIAVGSTVTWTYVVTNNTNADVTSITVTDDQGVAVNCPSDTLAPGASLTCTGSGTATAGQYMNTGTVSGMTPGGNSLNDSDPSHYFGESGTLQIEKATNGEDADTAPGPSVAAGSKIKWTYVVTNNTNAQVSGIVVTDDQGVVVTCPSDTLAPGASLVCTGTGQATAGQYANIGTVSGSTPSGNSISDSDPSHYFGESGTLDIEKSTNGQDADAAPGPSLTVGSTVTWTYVVTNNTNVQVTGIAVTDDQGVSVNCPSDTLAPGASLTCTGSGTVAPGQYQNIGTVSGTTPGGSPLSDTDPSHYFGESGTLDIEKATNGIDADVAPGPSLAVGSTVTWTYVVTNNTNSQVTTIAVTDDQGVSVSCPSDTLAPGASLTCTGSGTVTAGQYQNIGSVAGTTPGGNSLSDSDPSHYFGESGNLNIEKSTNGLDADSAPGPSIPVGDAVTWTYVITNNTNAEVTGITVTDDQGVVVSCPSDTLAPGASLTCTGTGTATAGQYMNIGTVSGTTPSGNSVSDTDPSHYFGESGTLDIEKSTNGQDADAAPGPSIAVGESVTWTYVVTNNSNAEITDITVTDDQSVVVSCPSAVLAPGASFTCTGSGTASAGQYMNIGTVTGSTPSGNSLSDTDPSHYFGESGSLSIEKRTNGQDADAAPGPSIAVGETVTWTYIVTNNTNADVTDITVTDDQGVAVSCPSDTLAAGASLTCTGMGTAIAGQYMNVGTVTGMTPGGNPLSDSDPSHYFGESGTLSIEKATNGQDADVAPGPSLPTGSAVTWTYVVTNNTNVLISNISVVDDQGVVVTCPSSTLAAGASLTCTGTGVATVGQYTNLGMVTGSTPGGTTLSASDPSHYFGEAGALVMEKATNGADADVAPGPMLVVGSTVTWTYTITNNSNVDVIGLSVTDDQGVVVTCPADTLAAGASLTCTGSGTATAGQYANLGTVTATTPGGTTVTASDPSHYFGESAKLVIEKLTNGEDADVAPGPSIAVGETVTWTYIVTNPGNVDVVGVTVSDDQGVAVSCPSDTLAAGGALTCTGVGTATAGQYMNIGTVTAMTPGGGAVSASDPSHYFGTADCVDGDVADEFEHVSYNNNDGSMDWSGPWKEHDPQGGGASAGSVMVAQGRLILRDYPDSHQQPSARRSVNLSGFQSAILTFDWDTSHETNHNDVAVVEVSSDGGQTWTVLETFRGNGQGIGGSENYDISSYISPNTTIRFRIKKKFGGQWDKFLVDNVRILKGCDGECAEGFVKDHFNHVAYDNNDGDMPWSGAWIEHDPYGGGAHSGSVRIHSGRLKLADVNNTDQVVSIERGVDLGGFARATLKYQWWVTHVEPSDTALVEMSVDGGQTFEVINTHTGLHGNQSGSEQIDLSGYLSENAVLRLRIKKGFGGHNEYFKLSYVKITKECTAQCDPGYVKDHFNHVSYGNNDGDMDWAGPWKEYDPEGQGPYGGSVRINGGRLKLSNPTGTWPRPWIRRTVDLSNTDAATLEFKWHVFNVEANDRVVVEVSSDGGQYFTVVKTFEGLHGNQTGYESIDISAFRAGSTVVRFRIENRFSGPHEYFKLDFVRVTKICH
ncbi:MAG: SdrD B-like domain-containing protein [Pseudomonadota bacterium]